MTTIRLASLMQGGEGVHIEVPPPQGAGRLLDFFSGGVMMYPIAFSGLVALGLTLWAGWRLAKSGARVDARVEAGVDGVLFWGGYALLLGVLGTVIGIATAAQAIEMIGEVHTTLVWGGIKVALITTIWGGAILAASALSWFLLRVRCRALLMRTA
jgi:hypothetical protein